MTFGLNHYVPVLKVKRGEKKALQAISSALQPQITPLLEIVKRKSDKTPDQHLNTAFTGLEQSVRGYSRCFLDVREIEADGEAVAGEVFRRAAQAGIIFSPVTGISRTVDVAPALTHRTHGLALRLMRTEFEKGSLETKVTGFLHQHGLTPEDIDLIIDLGAVEDMIMDGIATLTDAFMQEVPHHEKWRTFTVSGCAFPISMREVDRHSYALVERAEWHAWRSRLYERRKHLRRLPSFSDCAIQHPAGVEGFDPKKHQVSASIRYTLPDYWLLIKGQSTKSKHAVVQFPALATRLVKGDLKSYFAGEHHCLGCASMKEAANGALRLGSAGVWRQLGSIHHISMVMQGLSSLAWP